VAPKAREGGQSGFARRSPAPHSGRKRSAPKAREGGQSGFARRSPAPHSGCKRSAQRGGAARRPGAPPL